jgi:hypothetical protein
MDPGANVPKLAYRDGVKGAERILIDPGNSRRTKPITTRSIGIEDDGTRASSDEQRKPCSAACRLRCRPWHRLEPRTIFKQARR